MPIFLILKTLFCVIKLRNKCKSKHWRMEGRTILFYFLTTEVIIYGIIKKVRTIVINNIILKFQEEEKSCAMIRSL